MRNVSPEVRTSRQVIAGGQNAYTSIYGVSTEYFAIRSWTLKDGDFFTESDVRRAAKVAVIGKTVADELFNGGIAVGQTLRIGNVPFTIVGELNSKGMSVGGSDYDDAVLIPYTSAMKRLLGVTSFRSINIQTDSMDIMSTVQENLRELLRQTHHTPEGRDDDFTIRTQEEIASAMSQTQETMRYLLAGVAIVSLLVGGIGIMNIMLVSVTERTREIGIRMALGARTRDVLAQFLIEAVALSCTGGLIGIAAGVAAAKIVTQVKNWPTLTSPEAMVVAFLFSVLVGIFFGFYPARKASRLDPIEALRYE